MNRLKNFRVYLAGPIDRAEDNGAEWRDDITPFLHSLNMQVFDPLRKPIDIGLEGPEAKPYRAHLKENLAFDDLAREVKKIRVVDLRMVDLSDFVIVNWDTSIHMCGTIEEVIVANRNKRPILIRCVQGKIGMPDWMFGVLPHQFFFDTWEELKKYIKYVDSTTLQPEHFKRWTFFDYSKL